MRYLLNPSSEYNAESEDLKQDIMKMTDEMQRMAHELKTCKAKESRLKTDLNKLISEMATLEKQR